MAQIDTSALYTISCGLFLLSARDNGKDNACIVNTVMQVANSPVRVTVAVSKQNLTCEMIRNSGLFTVSVLTETAPFTLYKRFGFQSGRDTDKWAGIGEVRMENGVRYLTAHTCAALACRVTAAEDLGSHMLFTAELTEAVKLAEGTPVTYAYYHANVKPKPEAPKTEGGKITGYVCKICGYVYEGDPLPDDYVCPICKHPKEDFEPIRE